MKIITWNVNGMRAIVQKGFADFCHAERPDIIGIQETKCHPDQLDVPARTLKGYEDYWSAAQRPGYSGTATFTKVKPRAVRHGFGIPAFDAEGRMVVTEYDQFTLYNCYFPNGGGGPDRHVFKQNFLKHFSHYLVKRVRAGENVIVMGDYNVAYLDLDVYDPVALAKESGFLPEERAWMRGFLSRGFTDTFRHFHADEPHRYSWWSYFKNARTGNRGWRIDHICVSPGLVPKLKSVDILDQQMGSDHCPVRLEIDL